jgi:sulfite reductase (ferredoxin)
VLPGVVEAVEAELAAAGEAGQAVRVHVTGCPNGCARPYTAEIGVVGRTKTRYDVWVGGSTGGERLARRLATGVPLADLGPALRPVVERWRDERRPGEGIGDFCHRAALGEPLASAERETVPA